MFGPFWMILDHVWPSFPFRPARALKFARLGEYGLRKVSMECVLFRTMNVSMECVLFGTISGSYWNHFGTMFGLALFPNQLGL